MTDLNDTVKNCVYCGKKLPGSNTQKGNSIKTRSMEIGHIDPDMLFCTLRCAARFGVMVARATYGEQGHD